eukprot:CAMPEP_0174344296 /NCGR_PEP_ID=MMETSP0810-20121108/27577_1 /TAXON_ID=73025 ORGANISM="Eutreptiella gymnastica-like, Strain CCMP1594" /NCGR_SAMPLE_ID=MMETSP0810 /ASSEMBLY_ACC=CAM_ASM_000659 /LENGTH=63 /DNA_ID=CAMNT_0015467405 /DNA_START=820 /DNA_END=1011 /DNA_ORIENTATION=-
MPDKGRACIDVVWGGGVDCGLAPGAPPRRPLVKNRTASVLPGAAVRLQAATIGGRSWTTAWGV